MTSPGTDFPTDPTGLPEAIAPQMIALDPGAHFDLRIAPVAKHLGNATVRMLAYNGSIPGPTLRVQQGCEISINVVNDGDLEATVHWHGLRLENRYDGTHATQTPLKVGDRFRYRLTFPDPGVYWYHPHIREDYAQEMGLYGNIVVAPEEPHYWPPVNREVALTLDDVLVEHGRIAPFSPSHTNYTAMGRFGNVLLVNGSPSLSLAARKHEVVRLYLTNTANTRVFNVALPGARMKLVGGDSGHYEHEAHIDNVVLAPSERAVVDVLFHRAGALTLEHRTPNRTYPLASVSVSDQQANPILATDFALLHSHADLVAEREGIAAYLNAQPDQILALVAEMDMGMPSANSPTEYACPMHPDVRDERPSRCPKCGMKLVPAQLVQRSAHHMHGPEGDGSAVTGAPHHAPETASPSENTRGIEWEDDMVELNRLTTQQNMRWKVIDRATGAVGTAIKWRFRVGDRVKIRLVNEMDSDHPMHHPFHIHGAGRFLILSRDGVVEPNLVWKDTVLVRTGQTVDILFDVTNSGVWMAHCHIAEHHESGMLFSFEVDERGT
ncbi:MAG: multicopper oxidase family protein [Gemmatimonadota bacterium]